jgi:hypothetical protein
MSMGSGSCARGSVSAGVVLALIIGWLAVGVSPARALEALDGRIQAHGFAEMQVRGMSEKFGVNHNELDLAQWYNVLNVELEFDIFPDGYGPIDLMSAFVRLEGRYDCVYSHGCAMFKSVNTYGNDHQRLPRRLRDAEDPEYAGVIKLGPPINRIQNKTAARLGGIRETTFFGDLAVNDPNGPFPHYDVTVFPAGGGLIVRDGLSVYAIPKQVGKLQLTVANAVPIYVIPDPSGNLEQGGVKYRWDPTSTSPTQINWRSFDWDRTDSSPTLIPWRNYSWDDTGTSPLIFDQVNFTPALYFQGLSYATGNLTTGGQDPANGFPRCDPARGCPGAPGSTLPLELNPLYQEEIIERLGFPGFDTFNDLAGADGIPNTADDPGVYVMGELRNYRFALKDVRGPDGGAYTTQFIGPWLPKNYIVSRAQAADKANPLRGRTAPSQYTAKGLSASNHNDRYYTLSSDLASLPASNPLRSLLWLGDSPSDGYTSLVDPTPPELTSLFVDPSDPTWSNYYYRAPRDDAWFFSSGISQSDPTKKFGGDYSGIIPCLEPTRANATTNSGPTGLQQQIRGDTHNNGCLSFQNIRVTGGAGELPMRPAPDRSNLFAEFDPLYAQGLYVPSPGLLGYINSGGDWDNHGYNVDETNRAWNRGQAQEDNKELKEAYIDAEFFDSRLWVRLGLQNIVWGKTELFPTTDQFNPRDFALAGVLAGLEESRIALWSARFVYSLYNVGPLEDVRLEFAANLDDYEPIDLGACGEAFTINVVCSITTGLFAHGILGVGIAGIDRPPTFYKGIEGLEIGGRIEWRWDRFSFALIDFYGYNDFPFPDAIYYYDRSVEIGMIDYELPGSGPDGAGRPLASGFTAGCTGWWGGSGQKVWASANNNPHNYASMSQAGIGRDPACLKPGGAAGGLNQNGFTVARDAEGEVLYFRTDEYGNRVPGPGSKFITNGDDTWYPLFEFQGIPCASPDEFEDCQPMRYEVGLAESTFNGELFKDGWSPQNALENHTANQQSFAWICTATLTIGAALDPGACAFNLFGSPALLNRTLAPIPFVEVVSCLMAGEIGQACNNFMTVISNNVQGLLANRESGIVPLNRDPNDGLITATDQVFINRDQTPISGDSLGLLGFIGGKYLPGDEDMLTLDSTLTNEQRALLGCGPFFGTRCDTGLTDSGGPFGVNTCSAFGLGCTRGGGMDFINMEGNVLVQSFVGFEGTDLSDPAYTEHPLYSQWAAGGVNFAGTPYAEQGLWLTTSGLPQPGTMEFQGGPTCTRWVKELQDTIILPGCRGISGVMNRETARQDQEVVFYFDDGYDARKDGCVLGQSIDGVPVRGIYRDGSPVDLSPCFESTHKTGGYYAWRIGNSDASHPGQDAAQLIDWDFKPASISQALMSRPGSGTLWHPFAGCFVNPALAVSGSECIQVPYEDIEDIANPASPNYNPLLAARLANGGGVLDPVTGRYRGGVKQAGDVPRDFESAFFIPSGQINIGGATVFGFNLQSQIFRNELAAFSWNFMQFLVQASCDKDEDDVAGDPKCFDPRNQFAVGKCSYANPQLCTNVKGFFGAAGVQRNTLRASGNKRFGRRMFLWHSGGELNLEYEKRNILGFSMDFGEDRTKSNWGIEFTWVAEQNFFNNNEFVDNVSKSDVLNLTVSVDRPTFINFLNQNRTFFINSQWFFQYITNYQSGYVTTGPLNVLFTTAIFTGYFQDRLNPLLVTVFDIRSKSGGILPSVQYRFTDTLSVGIGVNFFFGQTHLVDMPVREFAPAANRAGKIAYKNGVDHAIASFRDKDEIWLKLRWTF